MKHTKILATYGPAIKSPDILKKLITAGVNAFRVNCSHGDKTDFQNATQAIRMAAKDSKYPIGLLFDISGPKLRLDRFGDGEIEIKKGGQLTLTSGESNIAAAVIGVNHPAIISSVKMGQRILIDDGNISLKIIATSPETITAVAINGGKLLPAKGINLPDTDIQIPTITEKDREDIQTAVEVGADYIALSFVRSGDDIIEARKLIKKLGGHQKIIAKLEKREAIANLEEIMILADGVMIARGDLGVELPQSELPSLQKRIIHLANQHHRPVIVATQMLESMRFAPRATRAEINDVAGAVFDHVDAVMLSAETATGEYPLEAVLAMAETINVVERGMAPPRIDTEKQFIGAPIPHSIANAVSAADQMCQIKVIFALTSSGYTAGLISNHFPDQPVIALSPNQVTINQLTLYRSVYSVAIETINSFDELIKTINEVAHRFGLAQTNENVIITGGAPFGCNLQTNLMMIHVIA